jgi:hypothetical protein
MEITRLDLFFYKASNFFRFEQSYIFQLKFEKTAHCIGYFGYGRKMKLFCSNRLLADDKSSRTAQITGSSGQLALNSGSNNLKPE